MSGESESNGRERPRTVAVFPDWRENPYLEQLRRGLESQGYKLLIPGRRWPVIPLLSTLQARGLPDVVHLHWQHPYVHGTTTLRTAVKVVSFILDLAGLRLLGVPVVWTVHNPVDHERTAPRLERIVSAFAARVVERVVVHCASARERVAEAYWLHQRRRERIEVVPHPNYNEAYSRLPDRRSARQELKIDPDQYVYLHFGSIRSYKRIPFLARPFIQPPRAGGTLLIAGWIGDEGLHEQLVRQAASSGRIRVDGRKIADEQVTSYLAAADAFVYGADRILMSGSVMLALTYGLPIVAPQAGCLPEVVPDEGAAWYEPGSEESLRKALADVRSLESRVNRANLRRAARYDRESVGRRLADIYRSVLET